jgi:hypothetical protein
MVAVLSFAGCPGDKEKSAREQAVDEVGGAPKRMVDEAEAKVNAAAEKAAARVDEAAAAGDAKPAQDDEDEGGW